MFSKKIRKDLSADGLFRLVKNDLEKKIKENNFRGKISLGDCLMSGFTLFSLKCASLLSFENEMKDNVVGRNLKSVYNIGEVPSDTYMRERLDEVDPESLRPIFKEIFHQAQRGKLLEDMTYLEHHIISIDGTGYFMSDKVHCESCMVKESRKTGKKSYYHQILGAVLVHPDQKEVIPLCPEPIIKQDGEKKNDCERNACKRILRKIREDHPKLKILIVEDALASNGPHIKELEKNRMSYILGVKEKDHKLLFKRAEEAYGIEYTEEEEKFEHRYRWVNGLPLNQSSRKGVNFIEYWEKNKKTGKTRYFSWVTNIEVTEENVYKIMRAGRARWKIENETFNTLKNQGYNFEHNYGHGKKNLSVVFAYLMMLAFGVDQIQQKACWLFKEAWEKSGTKVGLWRKIRSIFEMLEVDSMEAVLRAIAHGYHKPNLSENLYDTG